MLRSFLVLISAFILTVTSAAQISIFDVQGTSQILQRQRELLYRKPTKKELETVVPSLELTQKYAIFLRQPNTGLTKLIKDKNCSANTKVISADEHCLKYTMPGAGSSFSFRAETYRIPRLADLTYIDKSFQATGHLTHSLLVNIGDVPLEQVTTETKGLKFLVEFQPEPDYEKGKQVAQQLVKGIKKNGFLYRRGLYIVENETFVLRSIAYDGKSFRAVSGVTYNEFDFDERGDVTVAFRIVEKDNDENLTILWKKLVEKKSPKILWNKKEAEAGIKDKNKFTKDNE